MKNKGQDLRIIKTQNLLFTTLVNLMKDKPFEEIKVSDICSRALINRSTFYAHYTDKYELLSAYIDNLKTTLLEELSKNKNIGNTKQYYLEMLKLLLNQMDEEKEIYLSILINNRNSIMMDILYDVINHDITNHFKELDPVQNNKVPSEIVTKFYLGAVFAVSMEWLQTPNKYTKEQILEYLETLLPEEIEQKN